MSRLPGHFPWWFRYSVLRSGPGAPSPSPAADGAPAGWVRRWVIDPGGAERRLRRDLSDMIVQGWRDWASALFVVLATVIVVVVLVCWLRARAWRHACSSARWVQIDPPVRSQTANGQVMWRQLTGLLLAGGPGARVLSWEAFSAADRLRAGLWVPGTVGATQVAACVAASYRRSAARIYRPDRLDGPCVDLDQVRPRPGESGRRACRSAKGRRPLPTVGRVSVGCVVVPRSSMWQPLLSDMTVGSGRLTPRRIGSEAEDGADPLDGLWLFLQRLPTGYQGLVQILVRPLPGATRTMARRVRRAAGDQPSPSARATHGLLNLLTAVVVAAVSAAIDVITPGPAKGAGTRRGSGPNGRPVADPVVAAERRVMATKATAELVEVCVRIVVSGSHRRQCRALTWQAANTLRAVITAQGTATIRLPAAERRVQAHRLRNGIHLRGGGARHRRGWFVVTDTELGAFARLPHRPGQHGFAVSGAPHLPPPHGIPRLGTGDARCHPDGVDGPHARRAVRAHRRRDGEDREMPR